MADEGRQAALTLSNLTVALDGGDVVVDDVSLELAPGEILGLVGESGSGKTTTALSLLGYATPGAKIVGGELQISGTPLAMNDSMRRARGSLISYVPQDPSRALNPALRIAAAIGDIMKAHRAEGDAAVDRALDRVGLVPAHATHRFPHQLSGGQQQRVSIAMALSCEPAVVVLDEPTTGLDVVTQARILEELKRLRSEHNISMVYVTHDLAVVSQIADRIAVMYAGRIVEQGQAETLLRDPRHPYTRGLLASVPDHIRPRALEPMAGIALGVGERPSGCAFAPRCAQRTDRCQSEMPGLEPVAAEHLVRCFHSELTPELTSHAAYGRGGQLYDAGTPLLEVVQLRAEHRSLHEATVAAADISFSVSRGECVALVGESGSGKTTIARAICGLHPVAAGELRLGGQPLPSLVARRTREQRRQVQIVFQNPAGALNPHHTVREAIGRPAKVLRGLSNRALPGEVDRLLGCVRLTTRLGDRYPQELSGGERQRVSIARALAAQPEIILCDEITSALDVSVQAAVLKLLNELRDELGLSLLFITHDLGVVAAVADRVLVLDQGRICEQGVTEQVLQAPASEYTQRLLAAAPSISYVTADTDAVAERA